MNSSFHILLVDDEEDMLWSLKTILLREGYCLTEALTAERALHNANDLPLDLAIVDAKLSDGDGIEVAREIKKIKPYLPVLLISGYFYEDDSNVIEALQQGVIDGFIAKPFDVEEVIHKVKIKDK